MPGTEKTQHISLTTQVENRLKHQLSIGALKPGARLITKNIAQELGVSITPVREALLRLVSSSALAVAPAQAFMVPEISLESLLEINTMDREQTLNALLDEFQQALESGIMEKILLANRAFRFEIYHYADMPTLYAMIEQLWVRLGPSLHFLYDNFKLDDYQNGVNLYRKLLNALVTGDKEASRHCLQNVLQQNVATIKNQYFM
ncbi:TPA: GntR family transcriptional regulator [Salmonella enterica subsp. enterica serovar Muenchen]|uniref:GntR family transcriptional regulator n=1 Tax=Salmonella muenchen TaxID=596 RepID=A0A742I7I1_SALMU|nr:GntR family transcriptional regulator [Salmonella enterica subsp. enterica serovar Muenchen]